MRALAREDGTRLLLERHIPYIYPTFSVEGGDLPCIRGYCHVCDSLKSIECRQLFAFVKRIEQDRIGIDECLLLFLTGDCSCQAFRMNSVELPLNGKLSLEGEGLCLPERQRTKYLPCGAIHGGSHEGFAILGEGNLLHGGPVMKPPKMVATQPQVPKRERPVGLTDCQEPRVRGDG